MSTADEGKRTSYLELFFDLVFVLAITQVAGSLHEDHTASGWAHAGLLLWLVWWAWSQYAWTANAVDVERPGVRAAVLAVIGATLLAAVAIPDAFATQGAWFAVPYTAVRAAGLALYWAGLRDDPAHRAALRTYLPVASISPTLVLLGGLGPPSARAWIWTLAVVVDVASVAAAGRGDFQVAPGHFAERHALILLIALGESIIAVGATASELEPSARTAATAALAFTLIAALWWAYFTAVQPAAEARLAGEPDPRRRSHLARDLYTLGHLPLIAGTVVFAVAVEEVIAHPGEPLDAFTRVALAVCVALFAGGFGALRLRIGPFSPRPR